MKSGLKIRVALCLLVGSVVLAGCGSDNLPPEQVARRYLEQMRDAAYSSAYDWLTADSQLKYTRGQYADRLTRARQEAGLVRTEILRVQEPTVVGKKASVPYQLQITLQDGRQLTLSEALVLLQQADGWRVVWPPF